MGGPGLHPEVDSSPDLLDQHLTPPQPNLAYKVKVKKMKITRDTRSEGGTTTHTTGGALATGYAGKWVRAGRLGQGGCGTVFLEQNRETGHDRAVKLLEGGNTPMYDNEIAVMADVKRFSRQFVDFYCWFEDRSANMYIAMEYFSRGDLGKHVSSFGPLEEAKAADVARQILQGVFVLHKLGISHRDIKPENILVASVDPMVIKVADLGQGKILKHSYNSGVGTEGWAAPEIRTGYYDNSADMWSVGCVVYFILTALNPFIGGPVDEAPENICEFTFPFWPRLQLDRFQDSKAHPSPGGKLTRGDRILVKGISNSGNAFLTGLIDRDVASRMSAHKALNHPWICRTTALQVALENDDHQLAQLLARAPRRPDDILQGRSLEDAALVVLRVVAATGKFDFTCWALERLPPTYTFEYWIPKCTAKPALVGAATVGSLSIVKKLITDLGTDETSPTLLQHACMAAIAGRHDNVVEFLWPRLSERDRTWHRGLSEKIARFGSPRMRNDAHGLWTTRSRPGRTNEPPQVVARNDPRSAYAYHFPALVECTARHGLTDRVRWLLGKKPSPDTPIPDGALQSAAAGGHRDTVVLLMGSYPTEPAVPNPRNALFITALVDATIHGHMSIVKYLVEQGVIPSVEAINQAVQKNHTAIFRYLIHTLLHQAKFDARVVAQFIKAAAVPHCGGGLLHWLKTNRVDGSVPGNATDHVRQAARLGELETVKWLLVYVDESLIPEAIIGASEQGHVDIVTRLCRSLDDAAIAESWEGAAKGGHTAVLAHLLSRNPTPDSVVLTSALAAAVQYNRLETVLWLLCAGASVTGRGRIGSFVCEPIIQKLLSEFGHGV